jgi:acyl-CoA thioesterase I
MFWSAQKNSAPPGVHTNVEPLEPRQFLATLIMPFGDSITEGYEPDQTYRSYLWQDLKSAGYDVDFVGSQDNTINGNPGTGFDTDHEGHPGYTTFQLAAGAAQWEQQSGASIVLLHAGTNDIGTNESIDTIVNEIGTIIDQLRSVNSNITIVLSKIIPNRDNAARQQQLDDALPAFVAGKSTSQSRIVLVDPTTNFDVNADTISDGTHTNAAGAQILANAFLGGLEQVLPAPSQSLPNNGLPTNMTSLGILAFHGDSNGLGPIEKMQSNGGAAANDGTTIRIGSRKYTRGLGVDGNSRMDFVLNGRQNQLSTDFGIDNEVAGQGGTMVFKIYADGKRIFSSNIMTSGQAPSGVTLNVHGVKKLTLITSDAGDGNAGDHGDWADARLIV